MKTARFTFLIVAVALLGSCKKGGVFCHRESGEVVTETRDITNFYEIALATQGNVYVSQGDQYAVKIEASQNIIDIITTKVEGHTLVIDHKKGKCINGNPTINYYITTPELSGLKISGSGNIYVDGYTETNKMDMVISGSGNIYTDSLKCNILDMTISGSGNMNVEGVGTIASQDIVISGSGNINAYEAPVSNSIVTISGSGSAHVHALQTLKVNISGSGDVLYKGNATITTNISGSGDVRPY